MSDIVYRLNLRPGQLDVTMLQGRMLLDGFSAPYNWSGTTLRFTDGEKNTRYEIRPGRRLAPAR